MTQEMTQEMHKPRNARIKIFITLPNYGKISYQIDLSEGSNAKNRFISTSITTIPKMMCPAQQAIFDQGNEAGILAQHFPKWSGCVSKTTGIWRIQRQRP